MQTLAVAGSGATAELRPIGAAAVERVPLQTMRDVSATVWAGDSVDLIDSVDGDDAMVAVVLAASAAGWVVPARLLDGARDSASSQPTGGLATVDLAWDQSAPAWIVRDAVMLDSDGTVQVDVDGAAGESTIVALTVAGSVGGAARTVGVYAAAVEGSVAVAGARGMILVVTADTAAGPA